MSIFKNRKDKKLEKDIDELTRQLFLRSDLTDKQKMALLRDSGLDPDQVVSVMNYMNEGKYQELDVNKRQLETSTKLMFDPLKQCLTMFDEVLINQTEALSEILAKDMLRFVASMSTMSDNDFKQYVCLYYNYTFSTIKSITVADLEAEVAKCGLDGIYYEKGGEIYQSPSYTKKLTEFSNKIPDGLRSIIHNYNSFGRVNYYELYSGIFTTYQLAVVCFCHMCEAYNRYYNDFYILLNNCLLVIGENIPEKLLTKEFETVLKVVNKKNEKT